MRIPPLRWVDPPDGPAIELLDQTRLPATETVLTCRDVPSLVDAISRLAVRGAPLLGVGGAVGGARAACRGGAPPLPGRRRSRRGEGDHRRPPDRGEPGLGCRPGPRRLPARAV